MSRMMLPWTASTRSLSSRSECLSTRMFVIEELVVAVEVIEDVVTSTREGPTLGTVCHCTEVASALFTEVEVLGKVEFSLSLRRCCRTSRDGAIDFEIGSCQDHYCSGLREKSREKFERKVERKVVRKVQRKVVRKYHGSEKFKPELLCGRGIQPELLFSRGNSLIST